MAAGAAAAAGGSSAGGTAASSAKGASLMSGLDFGGNMLWNLVSTIQAKRMQKRQFEFEKNRYQYMRKDLKKAGYNPLLAMGGNLPSGAAGTAAQLRKIDSGSKYADLRRQAEMVDSQVNVMETQAEANSATAERQKADAAKAWVEAAYAKERKKTEKNLRRLYDNQSSLYENQSLAQAYQNKGHEIDYNLIDKYPWVRHIQKFLPMITNSAMSLLGGGAALKYLLPGKRNYSPKGKRGMGFQPPER